jgi:hypothetical protein
MASTHNNQNLSMTSKRVEEAEYLLPFDKMDSENKKKKIAALDRAWKNRDFEIDKYWSRATYFWAFIAATFAGYIAVVSSDKLDQAFKTRFSFIITCLGIIFSLAWWLVNIGSKKWQENWEKHIDMLEDEVTGPLYKTVLERKSYSVSRINILVSAFVFTIWIGLAVWQIIETRYKCSNCSLDVVMTASVIVTLFFIGLLLYTNNSPGDPYFFKRRTTNYAKPEQQKTVTKKENSAPKANNKPQ